MDQIKILRSVDEFVFDVALWPRDILRLLLSALAPWRVHARVKEEWAKPTDERFKDALSPSFFWLLVVVLPYFLLLDHYFRAVALKIPRLLDVTHQPWPVRLFALALLLAAWPLSCSLLLRKRSGKVKDRDTLKRLFLTHCIVLTPAALVLLSTLLLAATFRERRTRTLNGYLFGAFAVMSLYAEIAVSTCELEEGWFRRLDTAWSCLGRSILHATAVVLCGGALIIGSS
jgi:O-antigen ligase